MSSHTPRTVQALLWIARPTVLLVVIHVTVIVYAGVTVVVPWWRTRQFRNEVENLPGFVSLARPEWWRNRHLGRFSPYFERIDHVSTRTSAVDDDFLIRAAAVGTLESIRVRGSGITDVGVNALSREQSLRVVTLEETSVSNDGVASLAQLPELASLHVISGSSTLSDTAFEQIGRAQCLTHLTIGPVLLAEQAAADLAQVRTLEFLRIVGGTIDSRAVHHLGRMAGLRTLSLEANLDPETNPLPLLRLMTQLESLTLNTPAIDDVAARDLSRFGQLRNLNLADTSIGDGCMRRLAETDFPRRRLVSMNLSGTRITDICLYDLAQFSRLRSVDVRRTEFSEAAAAELCRLQPRVTVMYTDNNGGPEEMTWDRVHAETGGMMQWPPEEDD